MLTLYVNNVDTIAKQACTGGLLADERASNACHRWLIVLLVAAIARSWACRAMQGRPTRRPISPCSAITPRGRPARCSSLGSRSARWRRSDSASYWRAAAHRAAGRQILNQADSKGPTWRTNTMVLIVVAAFAALVLASVLALVVYKTRTQHAPQQRPDDPRSSRGGCATTSASRSARRRVRRAGPCGPGRGRHQNCPGVQPATASDGLSKRSSHLPRPTERAEGPSARWMTAAT